MDKIKELHHTVDYNSFLVEIKNQIKISQQKAFSAINQEMIMLYSHIGAMIEQKQKELGWGAKVIDKLSQDILREFPNMSGFSTRNLKRMVRFFKEYKDDFEKVPLTVAQIPWTHNIILIEKIKDKKLRYWYIQKILENGWSKDVLTLMIKSEVHKREGSLVSNFKNILPPLESDLVQQSFKDPYRFDFLTITEPFREKELENSLIKHMEKFLIELGSGFAFVGRQYKLEIGDDDFYIDLLFYHLKLRCFVVVELKKGKFKPEYSGQVNFYCSAVDSVLAQKEDKPTIGLILCQEKNEIVAEYFLRNMSQPIGISEYQLTEILPKEFESCLPTIENELKSNLEELLI
ncbi:MAG: PDDEXK nuclease domain-containing protein [Campylobacterales bacterium]|nr:PDDEXK nuclease domain-containing protein [Campylobacterales bacterium]